MDVGAGNIYDPAADSWTSIPVPFAQVGDAPSCVLPNGHVLMGDINSTKTSILNPSAKTWSPGGAKHDNSSEESWTLLPDHSILCAEVGNHPKAERYIVKTNKWINAGSVPAGHDLVLNVPGVSIEIGPAVLMPDGRVFCAGAGGHTALYNSKTHTWAGGPDFPASGGNLMRAFDAPGCLLPSGHVLCVVGPVNGGWSGPPGEFFEFDGAALVPVSAPAGAVTAPTYNMRLLLLPTGQALYSDCTDSLEIYTPTALSANEGETVG